MYSFPVHFRSVDSAMTALLCCVEYNKNLGCTGFTNIEMESQCTYIIKFKSLASNLLVFKKGVQYPDYELDVNFTRSRMTFLELPYKKRLARVHGPKLPIGKGYKMSISKSYVVTSH